MRILSPDSAVRVLFVDPHGAPLPSPHPAAPRADGPGAGHGGGQGRGGARLRGVHRGPQGVREGPAPAAGTSPSRTGSRRALGGIAQDRERHQAGGPGDHQAEVLALVDHELAFHVPLE